MSQKRLIDKQTSYSASAYEVVSEAINMDYVQEGSIQNIIDVATPTAKNWTAAGVNITDDTITITAHGLGSGLVGQVTTAGTLPTGLSLATNYFVIVVNVNTIKLATSLVNALAGTAVNLTAAGSGTSTFTPTAVNAGMTYEINNYTAEATGLPVESGWYAYQAEIPITADATEWFLVTQTPGFKWLRYVYRIDAGQINSINIVVMKGAQA